MHFRKSLKIMNLLPAVTDMQGDDEYRRLREQGRDIGLPGKAIEESLRLAPYTRRSWATSETSEDAHILSRNSS